MNAREIGSLPLGAVIERAEVARSAGQLTDAAGVYRTWLDASGGAPGRAIALFNYGVLAAETGQLDEAITAYQEANTLSNSLPQVNINLGLAFERKQQYDLAISQWCEAISKVDQAKVEVEGNGSKALKTTALNHIGRLLEQRKIYDQAEDALTKSLELDSRQADAAQHWLHLRQRQSKWDTNWTTSPIAESFAVQAMSPLASLAHTDDPVFHLAAAQAFVARKFAYKTGGLWSGPLEGREKIRIGYVSGDLCTHAVGLLMTPWLKAHDRKKFEIFAFDFSPEDGTSVRATIKESVDYFISIKSLSDEDAATLIRRCDIDVLVDMHGLSSGARPQIFASRPAALNVTLLGFLGTTAMEWNDWILADNYVIPPHWDKYYTERVIRLPGPILPVVDTAPAPTDKPAITGKGSTKKRIGCLNNGYKYTKEIVGIWGRALSQNPTWEISLLRDNEVSAKNIENELIKNGAIQDQIKWQSRMNIEEYRDHLKGLDLYVDTYPYNAGSTARDVLCARTPILTLSGRGYMSRVAGSLLLHFGLPVGVANTVGEYESRLVSLMSSDNELAAYQQAVDGLTFNEAQVSKNIRAFESMLADEMAKRKQARQG